MSSRRRNLVLGRTPKSMRMTGGEFEPHKWSEFFTAQNHCNVNGGDFYYYTRGTEGPLLVCIHGGGYSALTWALFAVEVTARIKCRVLSVDLRGHGSTRTDDDDNLSLVLLASDVVAIITAVDGNVSPVVLIGHSLGGAVAIEAAPLVPNLIAMCVIDIVEGTAIDSLAGMQNVLRARPRCFQTVQAAVQWGYRGGATQNLTAAQVSMPGQIKNSLTGRLASEEVEEGLIAPVTDVELAHGGSTTSTDTIDEVDDIGDGPDIPTIPSSMSLRPLPRSATSTSTSASASTSRPTYLWRIDLSSTERYWFPWFEGLSTKFLNINVPKILLLASITGLDTSLTVAQMQGKFQLQVMGRSGHTIHEDHPDEVAELIGGYLVRQRFTTAIEEVIPEAVPGPSGVQQHPTTN